MARESLEVNGYDLMDGGARDVEVLLLSSPAPQGDNSVIVGRTGAVWHRKRHGQGRFAVQVWVGDNRSSRAQVQAMWDDILRAVAQPHGLTTVVWTLSDGSTRTCYAEHTGEIVPAPIGQQGYRGQIEFAIPGAYWWGSSGNASDTGTSGTVVLAWLAAASAPHEHLVYTLTGPFTTLTVTSPSTGDEFTYAASVGAGETVAIDSAAGTVTGGGGHTGQPQALTYTSDRILTVAPGTPGTTPQVTYTSTGGSASTAVQVAGTAAYL